MMEKEAITWDVIKENSFSHFYVDRIFLQLDRKGSHMFQIIASSYKHFFFSLLRCFLFVRRQNRLLMDILH